MVIKLQKRPVRNEELQTSIKKQFAISVRNIEENKIRIHYRTSDQEHIIEHQFKSDNEQLEIKQIIPECIADLYISPDSSVVIDGCDPEAALVVQTTSTITNNRSFDCARIKLIGRSLNLQHEINVTNSCLLSFTEQLDNFGKLNIGTQFTCEGAKSGRINNYGVISGKEMMYFDSIARAMNYGLIWSDKKLIINSKTTCNYNTILSLDEFVAKSGKLFNLGVIFSQKELRMLCRNTLLNTPNSIIGSNTNATLMRNDGLSKTKAPETNTTFINQGSIEALNTITLTNSNGTVINEQLGKMQANKVSIGGHEFINSGDISGNSRVQVVLSNTDSCLYNKTTGEVKTKYLDCVFSQLLNDGKIYAQQELMSLLSNVHNQEHGQIISEGRLRLVALEKIINDYIIQAGEELIIHTSCLEVGVNGQLTANNISVIAHKIDTAGKIIANKCCEIISKYFNSLETSQTKSLEQLKLIVEQELYNQGLLHAKEKLLINNQGQVKNELSGVVSSNQIVLKAGELQNEGTIKAEHELNIKILNCLENLRSANISSLENLIIEVCGIVRNSGLISSEYQGLIKVSEILQNDESGSISAKELNLSVQQLDNFGTIEAIRQLKITSDDIITNYQLGKISSGQAVELLVNSLHNHGHIASNNLSLSIANMLHNYEAGVISAEDLLDLAGAKLIFNAGEISSLQDLEISSTEVLENVATGKITAVRGLTAIAELLISNKGKLTAHDVYLNSAKLLLLYGLQDLKHLTATAEIIDIDGETASKEINLEADVIEVDGKITTGTLNIEANNYLHLLKNGDISCSDASKLLSSAGFINLGKILSKNKLQIIAQELFHGVNAVISVEHDVYLKAIDMYLDGDIQASQKLLVIVENDFVYNTLNLKANGELSLTLADGTRINHNINTPGDLHFEFLTKDGLLYNNASLQAGGDLIINEPGYVILHGNYSQAALIAAKKNLVINGKKVVLQQGSLNAGHLDLTSKERLTVSEKAKLTGVDGSIRVTEDSFEQYGDLEFTGNLFINAKKELVLRGASKIGGILQAIAEGNISITDSIEAQDVFIASLLDSVEIRSHKERIGNSENFADILKRARVCAKNILQIFAQKDVVFESIETESGVGGTHIKSMANILDIPVDLVRQSVRHFHAKKCHGTIKDIWTEQVPSSHKTAGNFTYEAEVNGVYFAPKIQAENADICSGNDTTFMTVASSHSCEANLQGKKSGMFGSKTKTFSSCRGNAATIGTNFAIRGQLKVDSKRDLELHQPVSTAMHNEFSAGREASILHGRKSSYFSESSSSRDAMWSKSSSTSSSSEQYIAPQFSGSISIKAKSARIEVVSGRILDFLDQIKERPDDLTYVTLYEQYQYHHESHEAPGPGLIALIALATAIATQGTSSAWAASAIKAASASVTMSVGTAATVHAAVTAGFQALMVKATTSMAANNFDVGKAIKDLASSSTLKELAIKMISAGAMQYISGTLDIPTKSSLQSQAAVSEQALNVSAEINMGQRVINQVLKAGVDSGLHAVVENKDFDEVLGDAVKAAAIATATGSITDKIDASFANDSMDTATHTASHVLTSVASGIASNNHNGILVGAVEGLISARLPGMLAGKDQKSAKSADDLSAQEKLDAKTIRRQENSLHWIKQADLFGNPWDLEINDSAEIAQQFEEQQAQQSIMDRHGLDYPSKDPVRQPMWVEKIALKSLYYLASLTSGTAYADELPLIPSSKTQVDPTKLEGEATKTSWAERWEKSRAIVEETEQYDLHKLDRNFGSVMVGAGIGVGERAVELAGDLATAAVNLSMAASKCEQAYNPDHPRDLYSPQNEQLTAEADRIRERGNATLHKIIDDPKDTGKAILHGMSSYFREGLADIAEQHRQGDYLGAGRTIGKVGLDAYLVTTGVHSLGIQALDLAVGASKVVSNVAKVAGRTALGALVDSAELVAPRNSLLAFQYQSALRGAMLTERAATAAAKAASRIANRELQRELRSAAQARRSAAASSSMAQASSSSLPFVQEATTSRYVGTISNPVDYSVSLESLRNPVIREKFGIDGITEAPKFGGSWAEKDLLSQRALLEPVRLTVAEEELVTQWAFIRKAELERLNRISLDNINSPHLKDFLRTTTNQLRNHMTPDDLAAIIKENKGVKILKKSGNAFDHLAEWDEAKKSFEKLFKGGKESKMFFGLTEKELQAWEYQVGNISRIWDQYDVFVEQTRHLNKSKLVLKE